MCPECGSLRVAITPYDYGRCSQTGYHDAGERFRCRDCGASARVAIPNRSRADRKKRQCHQGSCTLVLGVDERVGGCLPRAAVAPAACAFDNNLLTLCRDLRFQKTGEAMTRAETTEILRHALIGYQVQQREIDRRIAELRRRLGIRVATVENAAEAGSKPAKPTPRISKAGRQRIAAATKERWRKAHAAGRTRLG